jgi:hypothetical protein
MSVRRPPRDECGRMIARHVKKPGILPPGWSAIKKGR